MQDKPRILLVDDEERILRSLMLLLRTQYEVVATTSGREAVRMLREQRIHVLISDQRMPEMSGTEVLRKAREISPHTVRLLLTGYADIDATLASVNDGEVFRYINKPWSARELRDIVATAAGIARRLQQSAPTPAKPVVNERLKVLVLDSDEQTMRMVHELIHASHDVLWAPTMAAALELLGHESVAVLVTELNLPRQNVGALLKTLKREQPQLLTVVVTSFKDTQKVAELINQAQVFRYLPKPVSRGMLARSLEFSITRHHSITAAPLLLESQQAEPIADEGERTMSSKIGEYLQRLRARSFFSKGTAPSTSH